MGSEDKSRKILFVAVFAIIIAVLVLFAFLLTRLCRNNKSVPKIVVVDYDKPMPQQAKSNMADTVLEIDGSNAPQFMPKPGTDLMFGMVSQRGGQRKNKLIGDESLNVFTGTVVDSTRKLHETSSALLVDQSAAVSLSLRHSVVEQSPLKLKEAEPSTTGKTSVN